MIHGGMVGQTAKQQLGIQNRRFPDIEILHDHSAAIGETLEIQGPETGEKTPYRSQNWAERKFLYIHGEPHQKFRQNWPEYENTRLKIQNSSSSQRQRIIHRSTS